MLPALQAFLHMMPLAQLALMLELTNAKLAAKEKQDMTWIGMCVLIGSIYFLWQMPQAQALVGPQCPHKVLTLLGPSRIRLVVQLLQQHMVCHQVVLSST